MRISRNNGPLANSGPGQLAGGGTAGGLSSNGLVALFLSADQLSTADTNGVTDLFARTLG